MSIGVLGTIYDIERRAYKEDNRFKRYAIGGYCDGVMKKIVLCKLKTHPDFVREGHEACERMEKEILRHEIIHAFLNESGLQANTLQPDGSWAENEEMVDWFAIQGVKIYEAWRQAGAL